MPRLPVLLALALSLVPLASAAVLYLPDASCMVPPIEIDAAVHVPVPTCVPVPEAHAPQLGNPVTDAMDGAPPGEYIDTVTNVVYRYESGALQPVGLSNAALGYQDIRVSVPGDVSARNLLGSVTSPCGSDICVSWYVAITGSHAVRVRVFLAWEANDHPAGRVIHDAAADGGEVTSSSGVRGFEVPPGWNEPFGVTATLEIDDAPKATAVGITRDPHGSPLVPWGTILAVVETIQRLADELPVKVVTAADTLA